MDCRPTPLDVLTADLSRRPVDLAVALVRAGARVVVVGGAARHLLGAPRVPKDLDLVVEPRAIDSLVQALALLDVMTTAARLLRCGCSRFATSYGPLDVFVGPAPPCVLTTSAGEVLQVAT